MVHAYYRFEKLGLTKSKTRFDMIAKSEPYPLLDAVKGKHGETYVYLNQGDYIEAHSKRKPDFTMSNKAGHISALFMPDFEHPELAHGDMKDSEDALLVNFERGRTIMNLFICKGMKDTQNMLFNLFQDGALDEEIELHKKKAKGQA